MRCHRGRCGKPRWGTCKVAPTGEYLAKKVFWRSYLLIKTITTQFQTVSVFLVFKSRWSEDRIKVLNCHNAHLKHNAQPRNREIKKSSITKTNLVWRGEWNHSLPKCTQKEQQNQPALGDHIGVEGRVEPGVGGEHGKGHVGSFPENCEIHVSELFWIRF